jgi:hypothetical protein
VGVDVTTCVGVAVGVTPRVGVAVGVTPRVGVAVGVTPRVGVAVGVPPRVGVAVGVTPRVGVAVGVGVGLLEPLQAWPFTVKLVGTGLLAVHVPLKPGGGLTWLLAATLPL